MADANQDITARLRRDKWHISGVDAEEAATLIEELRDQLAKARADERHVYQSFSSCDDERRRLNARIAELEATRSALIDATVAKNDLLTAIEADRDSLREEVAKLKLAEEGAAEAFGVVVQEKRDIEAEVERFRGLLDGAHATIRSLAKGSPALAGSPAGKASDAQG